MYTFIAPVFPPLALLAAINFLSLLWPPPVLIQLLLNAALSLHVGVLISCCLVKASYVEIKQCEEQIRSGSRSGFGWKHCWQILQYPLMGCAVLLVLYFVIKNVEQLTKEAILNFLFVIVITIYGGSKFHTIGLVFIQFMRDKWEVNLNILSLFERISKYLFCPLLAFLLALLYVVYKHWLLNNLFALFVTITAIKSAGVKTFKVALPILWSLFAYDMYWVYRSDVMVTVAKGIDLPLKLQFPYYNFVGDIEVSLLGLGDIIIPGLFLSLCLKYDVDNCILACNRQRPKTFRTPLYYISLGFYILGLLMTYSALYFFEKPQPALVFIVPCLSVALGFNLCLKERVPIWSYSSSAMAKSVGSMQRV